MKTTKSRLDTLEHVTKHLIEITSKIICDCPHKKLMPIEWRCVKCGTTFSNKYEQ